MHFGSYGMQSTWQYLLFTIILGRIHKFICFYFQPDTYIPFAWCAAWQTELWKYRLHKQTELCKESVFFRHLVRSIKRNAAWTVLFYLLLIGNRRTSSTASTYGSSSARLPSQQTHMFLCNMILPRSGLLLEIIGRVHVLSYIHGHFIGEHFGTEAVV